MKLILSETQSDLYTMCDSLESVYLIMSFTQIIDECNTQVGKMRQMEELIHLSGSLEFDKLKVKSLRMQTNQSMKSDFLFVCT